VVAKEISPRWHELFAWIVALSRAAQSACRCSRCELLRRVHQRVLKQVRSSIGKVSPRDMTFVPDEPASEFYELAMRAGVDDLFLFSLVHLKRQTTEAPDDFSLWGLLLVDPEGATATLGERRRPPTDDGKKPPAGKIWQGLLELSVAMARAQDSKCLCDRCAFFRGVYQRSLDQLQRWGTERQDSAGFLKAAHDLEFLLAAKARDVSAKWLEAARRAGGPKGEAALLAGLLVDPQGTREEWNRWIAEAVALQLRAALSPETQEAVHHTLGRLRQALDELANHGCRVDVHPALTFSQSGEALSWDVVTWCRYVLLADENVRSVAAQALEPPMPPCQGDEHQHPLWREIDQLQTVLRHFLDHGVEGVPLSDKGFRWGNYLIHMDEQVRRRALTALEESLRRLGR
jgi:hypothetical protein